MPFPIGNADNMLMTPIPFIFMSVATAHLSLGETWVKCLQAVWNLFMYFNTTPENNHNNA